MDPQDVLFSQVFEGKRNIYLTGPGGTGKSWLVNALREEWKERYPPTEILSITSTTGVSAICLNAETIHRWSGIKRGELDAAALLKRVRGSESAKKNWLNAKYLVIDEISMLSADVFDKLNFIAKRMRAKLVNESTGKSMRNEFFGGIKLIITGDPLQLPPIDGSWFFMSESWTEGKFYPIVLTIPHRYPSMEWFELLMRTRTGKCTLADIRLLKSKLIDKIPDNDLIKPTILNSLRRDVDEMNDYELDKLPAESLMFNSVDEFTSTETDSSGDIIPKRIERILYTKIMNGNVSQSLKFKIGAQIMLKINLSLADGLANGSRGVITDMFLSTEFAESWIEVKWVSGKVLKVSPNLYEFADESEQVAYSRIQIPLALAYSVSIHKSQGQTLDSVAVDLGPKVFEFGQAYTALSRVKCLEGLYLTEFNEKVLKAEPDALAFDEWIRGRVLKRDKLTLLTRSEVGK
jgi:ATP-dependent DNA helicase PIF1